MCTGFCYKIWWEGRGSYPDKSRCNSAKWTLLHKSRQVQGPLVQKDVSNLCSLSALQTGITPPHHLIGTRPSREWEIVNLKIGCPLFWLSPPSSPASKAQGSPGKNIQKSSSLSGESQEVLLEREGQHGEPSGDARHSTGGLVLACPPASGKEGFPAPPALEMQPQPPAPLEMWGQSHTDCPCPPGWCPQLTHCWRKAAQLGSCDRSYSSSFIVSCSESLFSHPFTLWRPFLQKSMQLLFQGNSICRQ